MLSESCNHLFMITGLSVYMHYHAYIQFGILSAWIQSLLLLLPRNHTNFLQSQKYYVQKLSDAHSTLTHTKILWWTRPLVLRWFWFLMSLSSTPHPHPRQSEQKMHRKFHFRSGCRNQSLLHQIVIKGVNVQGVPVTGSTWSRPKMDWSGWEFDYDLLKQISMSVLNWWGVSIYAALVLQSC